MSTGRADLLWYLMECSNEARTQYVKSRYAQILNDRKWLKRRIQFGDARYLSVLVENGADCKDVQFDREWLKRCIQFEGGRRLSFLLENGVNFKDVQCDCPYSHENPPEQISVGEYFVVKEATDMLELLCKNGYDVKHKVNVTVGGSFLNGFYDLSHDENKGRCSLLALAIRLQNLEAIKILLQYGANANATETILLKRYRKKLFRSDYLEATVTMLTYAIDSGSEKIVRLLLDHGATWDNIISLDGKSVIEKQFPYQKAFLIRYDICRDRKKKYLEFLRRNGWQGSSF